MADPTTLGGGIRATLTELEPLRRRVIRVYWTRGLLVALLLSAAAALGLAAAVASTLFVARATGGAEGELVLRIVPLVLAFVVPLALVTLGAGLAVVALLRRFGRATVQEYDRRFRIEVVAPLLSAAVPGARLDVDGRIDDAALEASGMFSATERGSVSGGFLVRGRAEGVSFAASTLHVRTRSGLLFRRRSVFHGFFGSLELEGGFQRTGALAAEGDNLRARLLELLSRAGARPFLSLHAGGLTIAVPAGRDPFAARRVRPNHPDELARHAVLYALVPEAARALAALSR